jgi:hypothetical protein
LNALQTSGILSAGFKFFQKLNGSTNDESAGVPIALQAFVCGVIVWEMLCAILFLWCAIQSHVAEEKDSLRACAVALAVRRFGEAFLA